MNEPGRKLFVYDSFCRDPMDWAHLKKHKRSYFGGAKAMMNLQQVGDEAGDTLAVLKNVYLTYRSERPDHLSEDIVACLVPGCGMDSPVNEMLQAGWKSLKSLGSKHLGPKIGTLRICQADLLSHIYTRGAWNRSPDHHLLFTYQANPQDCQGRKKMRYLKDNERAGDTYFNEWPVPMYQFSQMTRVTVLEHDNVFAEDMALPEEGEDGSGAAMISDLGDKVVAFPREWHMKLWQEMIHVWSVDAEVLFQPGSRQAFLAFVLERKRAVGIVKNKAHNDLVRNNLMQTVKALGLAPDRRPAKPSDVATWEASRGRPGAIALPVPTPARPKAPAGAGNGPVLGTALPSAPTVGVQQPVLTLTPPVPSPPPATTATRATQAALAAFGSSALR